MLANPFAPLVLIQDQGGVPLKLDITVTPSDEVQALRSQVHALQQELNDLQAQYNRVEYLYRCEVLISHQLADLCKEHGVKVPHRLYERPDSVLHPQ